LISKISTQKKKVWEIKNRKPKQSVKKKREVTKPGPRKKPTERQKN